MRIFFEEWQNIFENRQLATADFCPALSSDIELIINRQLTTADLTAEQLEMFFNVPFTHHREILRRTSNLNERLFYIEKCATEFWQVSKLKYALKEGLFEKESAEHIPLAATADEGERLVDSDIDWSKLDMQGYRLGIAVPVTREELEDSHGIVESVVYSEMPAAVIDIINEAMFTTTGTYTAADGTTKACKVKGPFASMAATATQFAGAVPTRKELLKMVSDVASKVDLEAPCWVMTDAMMAELRDVKIDSGSGRFLCENGMVLGYPVFTTSSVGADYVGFGDWSYQAAGFFGPWQIEADPYTLLRKNAVDFVLNTRFGTATLRSDAFALGKINKS